MLATGGAPPEQVAELVHQAVVENQFFVFPTSDLDAMIEARMAEVRQGLAWRDETELRRRRAPGAAASST